MAKYLTFVTGGLLSDFLTDNISDIITGNLSNVLAGILSHIITEILPDILSDMGSGSKQWAWMVLVSRG